MDDRFSLTLIIPKTIGDADFNLRRTGIEIKDHIMINELYTKLNTRNKYIKSTQHINRFQLEQLSNDCLNQANFLLGDIDWNKYF